MRSPAGGRVPGDARPPSGGVSRAGQESTRCDQIRIGITTYLKSTAPWHRDERGENPRNAMVTSAMTSSAACVKQVIDVEADIERLTFIGDLEILLQPPCSAFRADDLQVAGTGHQAHARNFSFAGWPALQGRERHVAVEA